MKKYRIQKMSINQALIEIIDENNGYIEKIHSLKLRHLIIKKFNSVGMVRNPTDILRELRQLRTQGYDVECICPRKSMYRIEKLGEKSNGKIV